MIHPMSPEDLLSLDKFIVDDAEPHIQVDKSKCALCQEKPCLYVCSAVCYQLTSENTIKFDYAGCLECGTCRVVCRTIGKGGVIKWEYPRGTFGVHYRQG